MRPSHLYSPLYVGLGRYAVIVTSMRAFCAIVVGDLGICWVRYPLNRRLQRRPIPVSTAVGVDSGKRHRGILQGSLAHAVALRQMRLRLTRQQE